LNRREKTRSVSCSAVGTEGRRRGVASPQRITQSYNAPSRCCCCCYYCPASCTAR